MNEWINWRLSNDWIMVKLTWVECEYESKMSMKIEDSKQEWKRLITRLQD